VTRTFTSAAVIAGLAAFLDGRPPAPAAALAGVSCPAPLVTPAHPESAIDATKAPALD
jgi:hypothetical protein